jgi:hypothetical protein
MVTFREERMNTARQNPEPEIAIDDARERIWEALKALRFGAVEIQVHDSRIVRITRTERVRVESVSGNGKHG